MHVRGMCSSGVCSFSLECHVGWRLKLGLVLANETGHRQGVIRKLQWSDVDLEAATVVWREENDKLGIRHETPLTKIAVEALGTAKENPEGRGSQWVLLSPRWPDRPISNTPPSVGGYRRRRSDWGNDRSAGMASGASSLLPCDTGRTQSCACWVAGKIQRQFKPVTSFPTWRSFGRRSGVLHFLDHATAQGTCR
jgi:hypothetical protein